MRLLAVHTCPLWEYPSGWRAPGMAHDPSHPPVVGWVNVAEVVIAGEVQRLLLTLDAC